MPVLTDLLLPIFVSAAFVFLVSSIIHMATPMHKGDYKGMPEEDRVLDAMRNAGLGPGQYMFPHCESLKEMDSPEMREKYARGPVGYVLLGPNGGMKMGKQLGSWFAYSLLISTIVAYIATLAMPLGASSTGVFRMTGATAMLGYAFASIPDSVWKHLPWSISLRFVLDGILYGLATAAAFTWLWPQG